MKVNPPVVFKEDEAPRPINFIPFGQYILVKPVAMDSQTKSGLYLPVGAGAQQSLSQVVEVLKLGEGKMLEDGSVVKFRVKEGDVLIIKKYLAVEYEKDQETYLVIDEDAIIGYRR